MQKYTPVFAESFFHDIQKYSPEKVIEYESGNPEQEEHKKRVYKEMPRRLFFFVFHDLGIVDRFYGSSQEYKKFGYHGKSRIRSCSMRIVQVLGENHIHIHEDGEKECEQKEVEDMPEVFFEILFQRIDIINRFMRPEPVPDIPEIQEEQSRPGDDESADRSVELVSEEYECESEQETKDGSEYPAERDEPEPFQSL